MASMKQQVHKISTLLLIALIGFAAVNKVTAFFFPSTDLFDAIRTYSIQGAGCPPGPLQLDPKWGPYSMLLFGLGEIVAVLLMYFGSFRAALVGTIYMVGLILMSYYCFIQTVWPEAFSEWFLTIATTVLTTLHVITITVPKDTKKSV